MNSINRGDSAIIYENLSSRMNRREFINNPSVERAIEEMSRTRRDISIRWDVEDPSRLRRKLADPSGIHSWSLFDPDRAINISNEVMAQQEAFSIFSQLCDAIALKPTGKFKRTLVKV